MISHDLERDIWTGLPVLELRKKYSVHYVQNYKCSVTSLNLHPLSYLIMAVSELCSGPKTSIEWKIDLFTWLFDECQISISAHIIEMDYEDNDTVFGTVLDFVCVTGEGSHRTALMQFLVARKAISAFSAMFVCPNMSDEDFSMLLDVLPRLDPKENYPDCVIVLYRSRLAARAAALALLVAAKRRVDLRWIVARELWRDMAERVWEKRFEFN